MYVETMIHLNREAYGIWADSKLYHVRILLELISKLAFRLGTIYYGLSETLR